MRAKQKNLGAELVSKQEAKEVKQIAKKLIDSADAHMRAHITSSRRVAERRVAEVAGLLEQLRRSRG